MKAKLTMILEMKKGFMCAVCNKKLHPFIDTDK